MGRISTRELFVGWIAAGSCAFAVTAVDGHAAAQTFPASYTAINCVNGMTNEPSWDSQSDQTGQAHTKLVSGPGGIAGDTVAAVFYSDDGEFLYLRMRISGDPVQAVDNYKSFSWGWGFDTDGDLTDIEVLAVLNGLGNSDAVELKDVDGADPAIATSSYGVATHSQAVDTGADSDTDGNNDFFVDIAVPLSDLTGTFNVDLGFVPVWGSTSNNGTGLNADLLCATDQTLPAIAPIIVGTQVSIESPASGSGIALTPTLSGTVEPGVTDFTLTIYDSVMAAVVSVTPGDAGLTYDSSGGTWSYTSTVMLMAGETYSATAQAVDNTVTATDTATGLTVTACTGAGECDDSNPCTSDACLSGICDNSNEAEGTTCNTTGICDGSGTCVECTVSFASSCDDSNECTTDACVTNACQNINSTAGTMCSAGGGNVCDGSGICIGCLLDIDCDGAAPACDTATNTCVECTGTNDSACNAPETCNTTTFACEFVCSSDNDCSGTTPACDTVSGICVACTADSFCAGSATCNLTAFRCEGDADGDGVEDGADADADNDGIRDVDELGGTDASGDTDNDGTPDWQDPDATGFVDSDSNGADDRYDTDGDGIPDHLDLDSDNDGISDLVEGHDFNGDGVADVQPSGTDSDGDGLDDAFDPDSGVMLLEPPDTDGDGIPDFQDPDDDNDGVPTAMETGDSDGDGRPDYLNLAGGIAGGGGFCAVDPAAGAPWAWLWLLIPIAGLWRRKTSPLEPPF